MNLQSKFNQLTQKLTPHVGIWENEILMQYPRPFDFYPAEWLDFLEQAPDDVLLKLEMKNYEGLDLPASFRDHALEFQEMCQLPAFQKAPENPFDAYAFLNIKPKKQYEIETLAPEVNEIMKSHALSEVIDIGGGIGYLAQAITNFYHHPVTSIDMDPVLQATGMERNRKNQKLNSPLVNYMLEKLELGNLKLVPLFSPKSISLGLHTCGELANTHLELAVSAGAGALINLGCCYYKISKHKSYNLSTYAKTNPHLTLNLFALSLATNAHKQVGPSNYLNKNMVKNFRYALHIYMDEVMGIKNFTTLGSSHKKFYQGNFGAYALEQLRKINLTCPDSEESLNQFFADQTRSRLVKRMILSGIIRGVYGRALELYVLTDRALYLEENGYSAELIAYFDEAISPRNIGIKAIKKN